MFRRGVAWVALLVASSCPAFVRAQSATAGGEVVDPWRAHKRAPPQRMLLDLEDPWADASRGAELVNPWRDKRARVGLRGQRLEVVDPWNRDSGVVPTAAFPLLDPWQARASGAAPAQTARPPIPTAAFPIVGVVNPW